MSTFIFLCAFSLSASPADGAWPQFLGPACNGTSQQADLPLEWSESKHVRWKTAIHDRGHSSPVVLGNHIWLTTATEDGKQLFAICVDRESGRIVHDIRVFDVEKPGPVHDLNSYASPTPIVEPGRVYVHFGTYGTACLDAASGEKIWSRRDLHCDHLLGPGSSPLLYKNLIVLNFDGVDVQYAVALDKSTGATIWKTARSTDYSQLKSDKRKAYSTPVVIDAGGPVLITCGAQAAEALMPESGKMIWKVRYPGGYSNVCRPLYGDGLLYLNTGFDRPEILAVRPDGRGDITKSIAWKCSVKNLPTKPSMVLVNGLLYFVSDGGYAMCLDAKSGETVWQDRIRGRFSASPLAVPGRIYFFDQDGKATVIAPERKLKVLATNQLDEGCMASPAVSGKALIVRTSGHLLRIEE